MGEFLALSHSSIMFPHNIRVRTWSRTQCCLSRYQPMSIMPLSLCTWTGPPQNIFMQPKRILSGISAVSDFKAPTTFTVDSAGGDYDVLPESGGGGDGFGDSSDKGGNGGNNGGNEGGSDEEGEDQNGESINMKAILSMSQILKLGYDFLVGIDRFMGYLETESLKALISAGLLASFLCYVYNYDGNEGGSDEEGKDQNEESVKKKAILSMPQKLTLGYVFLVVASGVMGYLKTESLNSLISGGLPASLQYYVYTMLPANPVLAPSVGIILSAGFLGVMGLHFMESKKIFPDSIISIVSFIMTGGYLHGIM